MHFAQNIQGLIVISQNVQSQTEDLQINSEKLNCRRIFELQPALFVEIVQGPRSARLLLVAFKWVELGLGALGLWGWAV